MYNYNVQKPRLFTDDGQRMFLKIRDNVFRLLKQSGAVRMQEAIAGCSGGDSWDMFACMDRLVELGDIVEVDAANQRPGHYRIFVRHPNAQ